MTKYSVTKSNLRANTELSIWKIADLLGVHRRVVERFALKHKIR
ncbi:MAG: hypothetical protein PHC92_03415 [Syntrophomonadaceae bacterium]|nr:hypothetical protein [Syntrophomonadaceae bacterium]